jgi:NAD(P)-dependent dehydrogenase (short-subunit alcohol dehydrogenase family)
MSSKNSRRDLTAGAEMTILKGQCAIITGAAGTLGFAIAKRLAEAGASVVVADIKGQEEAAARLVALGHIAVAGDVDVVSDQSVSDLVESVMKRFGRIDILVNSAAIASALKPAPFEAVPAEQWLQIYDVNVVGLIRMCKAVSPHMRSAKAGRIINLTSGTAYKGTPGVLQYVATKGAVISVTRSLASEFAVDNVLVNAVSPGFTITENTKATPEMIERFLAAARATRVIKRDATPDDVANVINFLAGPDSGFVTGQVIVADGGSVFN